MLFSSYHASYLPTVGYPVGYPGSVPRYVNPRFARLDVLDWEFRSKPGLKTRVDPSGVISRGRSVVRIKTRIGRNPGARLVEKFIIREPQVGTRVARGFDVAKTGSEPISQKETRGRVGSPVGGIESNLPSVDEEIKNTQNPSKSTQKSPSVADEFDCLSEQPTLQQPKKREPDKNSPSYGEPSTEELPFFSDRVPEGVKKVQPLKPSSEPSICVSDVNASQIRAKSKISLTITEKQLIEPVKSNEDSSCVVSVNEAENPTVSSPVNPGSPQPTTETGIQNVAATKTSSTNPVNFGKDENSVQVSSKTGLSGETRLPDSTAKSRLSSQSVESAKNDKSEDKGKNCVDISQPIESTGSQIQSAVSNNKNAGKTKQTSNVSVSQDFEENKDSVVPPKETGKAPGKIGLNGKTQNLPVGNLILPKSGVTSLVESAKGVKSVDTKSDIKGGNCVDLRPTEPFGSQIEIGVATGQKVEDRLDAGKTKESSTNAPVSRDCEKVKSGQNKLPKESSQKPAQTGLNKKTQNSSFSKTFESSDAVDSAKDAKPVDAVSDVKKVNCVDSSQSKSEPAGNETQSALASGQNAKTKESSTNVPVSQDSGEIIKSSKESCQEQVKTGLGEKTQNLAVGNLSISKSSGSEAGGSEKDSKPADVESDVKGKKSKAKGGKKVARKRSSKENQNELTVESLDELGVLFEEYRIVNSDIVNSVLVEQGWELIDVIVAMEGTKKKKKVIVKKKGSKVKVTPLEAKAVNPSDTASPGDITRQLSKKRVSLADDDLNLVGFNPDKRTSITDDVLVEEAALLDKMIHKEMRDVRKSSLAFPPISEEKVDAEVEQIAAQLVKTPSPKRVVPSPQERREAWKKNALRKSLKSLGGFFKPHAPPPQSSSEDESECDVNCHPKCMVLMPNLCGVNQKLMAEALSSLKRGRRSASGSHSRVSIFKIDSESEDSQGRVSPPKAPAKTLPRFRTYTINDFQFLKVLGKGSFGKVLLAELKGSQCYYAVKCLKKDVVLEDDDVECTMIERKVLALGTGHPYFCHLFCTFQTDSHLFFVMEYLNGGDLMFHIQQSGRFDEGRARFYAAEIVSALAFLHKLGIVYRDLKLDNVLLDFDGHVRIADFGMCKLQIYLDKTTDTFCGTPDYMAPEVIKGLKYNQCVDWWSFGILLYEMLVGQSPFSGCDEDHLFWSICNERPHMPRHLSRSAISILRDLLEKDWTKRLGSSEFGSQDVMNHSFFDGMKWYLLEKRMVDPPYKPTTRHPLDTKYFDPAFTSEKPTLTPVDKTILESMDQSQFEGFSYTNPNATE